jgi:hypothetical protein
MDGKSKSDRIQDPHGRDAKRTAWVEEKKKEGVMKRRSSNERSREQAPEGERVSGPRLFY